MLVDNRKHHLPVVVARRLIRVGKCLLHPVDRLQLLRTYVIRPDLLQQRVNESKLMGKSKKSECHKLLQELFGTRQVNEVVCEAVGCNFYDVFTILLRKLGFPHVAVANEEQFSEYFQQHGNQLYLPTKKFLDAIRNTHWPPALSFDETGRVKWGRIYLASDLSVSKDNWPKRDRSIQRLKTRREERGSRRPSTTEQVLLLSFRSGKKFESSKGRSLTATHSKVCDGCPNVMACRPYKVSGHEVEAINSQIHNINLQETNSYDVEGLWMPECTQDIFSRPRASQNFDMLETSVVVEECAIYFK